MKLVWTKKKLSAWGRITCSFCPQRKT